MHREDCEEDDDDQDVEESDSEEEEEEEGSGAPDAARAKRPRGTVGDSDDEEEEDSEEEDAAATPSAASPASRRVSDTPGIALLARDALPGLRVWCYFDDGFWYDGNITAVRETVCTVLFRDGEKLNDVQVSELRRDDEIEQEEEEGSGADNAPAKRLRQNGKRCSVAEEPPDEVVCELLVEPKNWARKADDEAVILFQGLRWLEIKKSEVTRARAPPLSHSASNANILSRL